MTLNDRIDCEVIIKEMKWTLQAHKIALILGKIAELENMFIQ